MKLRRRTFRRLGAFLIVVVFAAAAGLWLHGRGERRQAQELLDQRRHGLELVSLGDPLAALQRLSHYLTEADPDRVERDFEARLAYAKARLQVHESGERNIEQSARLLRDLVDDFPNHPQRLEAMHLLMRVTREGADWTELRRLSDEALDDYPLDMTALRMRRLALEQLGDFASALADSQRLTELTPHDVDEQIWTLGLLARLDYSPDAIVQRAVDLAERHSQDPRFLLVLAVAYKNAGQAQQAVACLRQAAQSNMPQDGLVAYVARLAGLFDTFGEHDLAREAYGKALQSAEVDDEQSRRLRQLLALRLWQAGQLDEALAVVPALSTAERRGNSQLVATRILLQFEHGDTAEATLSLKMLGSAAAATTDAEHRRLALAWHEALSSKYATEQQTVRQRLEALRRAHTRLRADAAPASPLPTDEPAGVLLKWLGDLHAQLGETEQAVLHWQEAARSLPGWDEPHLLVAEATLEQGLLDDAERAARDALTRDSPDNERAVVLLARIAYEQWLASPSTGGAQEAAAQAARHQRDHPLDPATLPIHIHMLALSDPAAARQLVRDRLQMGADPQLRVELAEVTRRARLGMQEELLEGLEHPDALLMQARDLASQGDVERGRELMDRPPSAAASPVEWAMARARFLEAIDPAEAAATWKRLGAANAQDVTVQLAVLNEGGAAQEDRAFIAQTIERLAQLTGPAGRRWRLERAKWLLAQPTTEAALDAADLLRSLIRDSGGGDAAEERLLLSQALMIGGNLQVAIDHLEAAYALNTRHGDIGLRLIALYERTGRRDEARRLLGRLAAEGVTGSRQRLEVASRLAELGDLDTAINLLEQADIASRLEPEGQAVLAEFLQRAGRMDDASTVYVALLASDAASPAALHSAAVFYGRQGDVQEADRVLSRLERTELTHTERATIRGSYHARIGDMEAAQTAFEQALASAPQYAAPWREAIALQMSRGDPAHGLQITTRAAEAGVVDDRLIALRVQCAASAALPPEADRASQLEALSAAALAEPGRVAWRPLAQAIARAAEAAREHQAIPLSELARLERAAEVFERYVPLHLSLAEAYSAHGRAEEAARVARGLAEAAPHDPEAQRLAFESCLAAGHRAEAKQYALRWDALSPAESVGPDTAVAEALLLEGDFAGAMKLLKPHVSQARQRPSQFARLLALTAEAHAGLGQYQPALELIAPHLRESSAWREVGMRLAGDRIEDPQEALEWLNTLEAILAELSGLSVRTSTATTSATEQRQLATAWSRAGYRLEHREALDRGHRRLAELADGPLNQDPEAWEALAQSALWAQDLNQAESAYRRLLALDPRRASAANELARLLLRSEEPLIRQEALTWARIAAEQDPSEPAFQHTLGRAHEAMRQPAAAREAYERALRLDDDHLESMLDLSDLLADSGEVEIARRWLGRLQPIYARSNRTEPRLREAFDRLQARLSTEGF